MVVRINNNYLTHHGIHNQKWGVRRYKNRDGSYTEAGRHRYGVGSKNDRTRDEYCRTLNRGKKAMGSIFSNISINDAKRHGISIKEARGMDFVKNIPESFLSLTIGSIGGVV